MLEYDNLEAFLPIREVSSGWIKNIHEFLHQGQQIVCKVILFDKDKNTIDISLKRVTPADSKEKMGAYNLEKRFKTLFIQKSKSVKDEKPEQLEDTVRSEFGTYTNLISNAIRNTEEFKNSKLPKLIKDTIINEIEENKKKKRYVVSYLLITSTTNTSKGVSELKSLFSSIKTTGVDIRYISAPKYRMRSEGKDFMDAENKIKQVVELIKSKQTKDLTFEVEKEKLKRDKESLLDYMFK